MDALEIFINEMERQLDRNVKIVRSDRDDEYYGRYSESGQHPDPFAKFLESVVFVFNTQCQVHYNKMLCQKGVIKP